MASWNDRPLTGWRRTLLWIPLAPVVILIGVPLRIVGVLNEWIEDWLGV